MTRDGCCVQNEAEIAYMFLFNGILGCAQAVALLEHSQLN